MVKYQLLEKNGHILSEKYVSSLLLFLRKNGETHASDLKEISSYYQGIVKKAESLRDIGLIDIEIQSKPFHKKTFRLTSDGIMIADKLYEAEVMLKDMIEKDLEDDQAFLK